MIWLVVVRLLKFGEELLHTATLLAKTLTVERHHSSAIKVPYGLTMLKQSSQFILQGEENKTRNA